MTNFEIIQLFLGSGGLIGILFLFFKIGKTAQKITQIDTSLDDFKLHVKSSFIDSQDYFDKRLIEMKLDNEKFLFEIRTDIKDIKRCLNSIEVQIGKLETRVEERTLRVIKGNYEHEPAVR